jgi:hypothetical protein
VLAETYTGKAFQAKWHYFTRISARPRYDLQAPAGHLPSAAIRAAGNGKARTLILSRLEGCQSC